MELSGFELKRIDADYDIKPFRCSDDDLTDFFMNDAKPSIRSLLTVTYVIEKGNQTVAFFSLLNDKITAEEVKSKRYFNKVFKLQLPESKGFHSYPAVKIARLGVGKDFTGQGWGTEILNYIKQTFIKNNRTGCRYITVDAYNKPDTLKFYEKNKFVYLEEHPDKVKESTKLMYFNLTTLT